MKAAALQYWAWRVTAAVIRRTPPGVAYGVAWIAGSIGFWAWPGGRRRTEANFRHVLGSARPREVRSAARRSLVNYCCYLVDFIRFGSLTPEQILDAVEGEEQFRAFDETFAHGRGVVVVCMHFGNWDLGAGATAVLGYPATVVGETFADPRLDELVVGARTRLGMRLLKMEKAGPSLARTLRHRGILALLIDRPVTDGGVKVSFFREEVQVPAGPARLAIASGAKVVVAGFPRIKPGEMPVATLADFGIETPGRHDPEGVRNLTQAIMDAHERFIQQYPDQWYMFREMWPRRRQRARRL